MSERVINISCFALAFIAFVLNLTANCSDHWWVSRFPQEFENVGLWQICFNHYRHRFDFYGKIYTGCWWIFSPETRMLFSWISTTWLRWVQALCTLSLFGQLFTLIMIYTLVTSQTISKVSSTFILSTSYVTLGTGLFQTIAVITFGMRGKDRDWMPRWQQNWYGWSFIVACIACFFQVAAGLVLLFEGTNMKLVKKYMEKMYIQKKRLFPPAPK
jgi:hypothetical protein